MVAPLDYTSAFANVPSPNDALMAGYKDGAGIRELELKRQQEAIALAQKKQQQTDLATLAASPTTDAIVRMSLKYPALSEGFKRSFDMLEPAQKQAKLDHAAQVYAALHNGKPEIAREVLKQQAAAARNSGNETDAKAADTMAGLIEHDPNFAKTSAGLILSSAMGPDKFAATFTALGGEERAQAKAPSELAKSEADARGAAADADTKQVTAKYADSQAVADLAKKQWDVKAIVADIGFKKESNRIAAMNAAANREGNTLKRQELQLKIEDAKRERDDKLRGKVADVESAASNMDNMLNTIARIKKNPSLSSVVGSLEGKAYYPNALMGGLNPLGDGDERADAIALIDTLGSQAFLSQIPNIKGMGALSNAEGEKLQSAFQNLGRAQSEKQFEETLTEASRLLNKGRETLSKRYGVPLGAPDTPAAAGERPPLSSFSR